MPTKIDRRRLRKKNRKNKRRRGGKTHIQTNKKNESRASQIPNKSSRNILRAQIRDDKKISNKERSAGREK